MITFKIKLGSRYCPTFIVIILLSCVSASVIPRHNIQQNFDLDAAAAEPRPIFINSGPSAETLPLVYSVDSTAGPLIDASEKVEKILKPTRTFSYNQKHDDDDGESEDNDQKTAAVDYYKYVENEEKKERAAKEGDHDEEAGGQSAESQHHGHHHEDAKKGDHGGGDHGAEFEKGAGKDSYAHHHGEHGEKGDKGYKGHHHHEKGEKGHHDKEDHKKEYDEGGGQKKDHHHEDGYHGEYHKDHHGKKGSKFSEDGEHSKGHNTKGSHNIHKKDEFDKKTEFFEEEYEGGESEKHGGFSHKDEYHKGGHQQGGYKKGGHHEGDYGKKGESSKGGFFKERKGHDKKGGHDKHHEHEEKHGGKEGQNTGKKWGYKEGSDDGGGGGDGHGHGAHSHQNYAVQKPPEKEQAVEASVKTYDIPPIIHFVLPLEGEAEDDGLKQHHPHHQIKNAKVEHSEGVDREGHSSVLSNTVVYKEPKLKKRRPTPTDDFLTDSPFSPAATKKSVAVRANKDGELKQQHQIQRVKFEHNKDADEDLSELVKPVLYREPKRRPTPFADSPFSPDATEKSVTIRDNHDGREKQPHQIQKVKFEHKKGAYGDGDSSELIKAESYKEPKLNKRRPSATDEFLVDSPFSPDATEKLSAVRANKDGESQKAKSDYKKGVDGTPNSSELTETVPYKEPKFKKRRPSPTDDFLAESPFRPAVTKKSSTVRANGNGKGQKAKGEYKKGTDGTPNSSELSKTVSYREPKLKKRGPSPTDDLLAESPFSPAETENLSVVSANEDGESQNAKGKYQKNADGTRDSSELTKTVSYKKPKLKKRRPPPTDDLLADSPLSPAPTKKSVTVRANEGPEIILPLTSVSPSELLIRGDLIKNTQTDSTIEQQTNDPSKLKPAEARKTNKKRRLKKRKLQKEVKILQTPESYSQVVPCPFSHKSEPHIPQETSHSFVIVAADSSE